MLRDFLLISVFWLILLILGGMVTYVARGGDSMVGLLERHFQVTPGSTRVLPECQCTVRYVGTTVHGRRYTVIIDKLD